MEKESAVVGAVSQEQAKDPPATLSCLTSLRSPAYPPTHSPYINNLGYKATPRHFHQAEPRPISETPPLGSDIKFCLKSNPSLKHHSDIFSYQIQMKPTIPFPHVPSRNTKGTDGWQFISTKPPSSTIPQLNIGIDINVKAQQKALARLLEQPKSNTSIRVSLFPIQAYKTQLF